MNTTPNSSSNGSSTTQNTPPADSSTAPQSQLPEAAARLADGLLDTAVEIGAVWVRHGLDIGRLALRTHSAWLKGVSQLLGQVADAIPHTEHTDARTHEETATRE